MTKHAAAGDHPHCRNLVLWGGKPTPDHTVLQGAGRAQKRQEVACDQVCAARPHEPTPTTDTVSDKEQDR